jgi:hypothetical protein
LTRFLGGVLTLFVLTSVATSASADVIRIDIRRRDVIGKYERLIGRVYFAIDPANPANRPIADLDAAPVNAAGLVEFSSDVMIIRPRTAEHTLGTVFLEIVNRGREQSLGLMSGGVTPDDAAPEHWDLGDRFVLEQGFTLAFLGWQFDVPAGRGLSAQVPVAAVRGLVRASHVERHASTSNVVIGLEYCAPATVQAAATVTFRTAIDGPAETIPRGDWQFASNGCAVRLSRGRGAGLYEVVYETHGSPIAGLGFAAVRDFTSYLKHGGAPTALRERPEVLHRVLGFGYSQSARFLREFARDGFNRDEHGRMAFDALLVASAGAGIGSFNHRFAMPGQAGNSVLSILRPVDVPPFDDDGLLAKAKADGAVPKIFYTFSSTEYWARAGSLSVTDPAGTADVPLAPTSRLYFLAGTPHAGGPLPPVRTAEFDHRLNFAEQRWTLRALTLALEAWIHDDVEPPASRFPTIASGQLVSREAVTFPSIPSLPFPAYLPGVWRMDYGADFTRTGIITKEPPALGAPFVVLVPQVDSDGNDLGGIRLPDLAVPLGTFTGWNVAIPPMPGLHYLAGLVGSFDPFARTRAERMRAHDPRPSIEERYKNRTDYLSRVSQAVAGLVGDRYLLASDAPMVIARAKAVWSAIVDAEAETGR